MNLNFEQFFQHYKQHTNQKLEAILAEPTIGSERLLEAMRYSLVLGGKRVRPCLTYAAAQATLPPTHTGTNPLVDAVACAVECIHAYSLIHDDLPAMDDDELRRGEPTNHIKFDEATAILAGDALQALAFETLATTPAANPALVLKLVGELSKAAGAKGMVAGQAIDLFSVDKDISLVLLEKMHRHKTGALIEAAVVMGALAGAEVSEREVHALRLYAQAIGLSFQVQDDILDVTADTKTLGKRQGADEELNKPTYVKILGLEGARQKAQDLHEQALTALEGFDERADILRELSEFIVNRHS